MAESTWFDDVMAKDRQAPVAAEEEPIAEEPVFPEESTPVRSCKKGLWLWLGAAAAAVAVAVALILTFGITGQQRDGYDLFTCDRVPARSSGLWGYLDPEGQWAIEQQFQEAGYFTEDGLAVVKLKDQYGVIDTDGNWVIQPQYQYLSDFEYNGLLRAQIHSGKVGVLDAQGQWVVQPVYNAINTFSKNGLARFIGKNKDYGYLDAEGNEVIPEQFEKAKNFSEKGFAKVRVNGKWGLINVNGSLVIPAEYDDVDDFSDNGMARVEQDGLYGYVNRQGQLTVPISFTEAEPFGANRLAPVKLDGKYGYIDSTGYYVVPPQYREAYPFANGFARVVETNKVGFINEQGQLVMSCQFENAADFDANGLAVVKLEGKYGYVRADGQWAIPPQYVDAKPFMENGLAAVKVNTEDQGKVWTVINEQGEYVLEPKYFEIRADETLDDVFYVNAEGKWSLVDQYGQQILVDVEKADDMLYIACFQKNRFVTRDGYILIIGYDVETVSYGMGVMDLEGNVIIPPRISIRYTDRAAEYD